MLISCDFDSYFADLRNKLRETMKKRKLSVREKLKEIASLINEADEKFDELPDDLDEIFWTLNAHISLQEKYDEIYVLLF